MSQDRLCFGSFNSDMDATNLLSVLCRYWSFSTGMYAACTSSGSLPRCHFAPFFFAFEGRLFS
jgi:hypothetical protein